jgi:hypothetical protein
MLIQSSDMPNPGKILDLTWHKQDEELDIQVPEQGNKLCSRPNNIWRVFANYMYSGPLHNSYYNTKNYNYSRQFN